MTSLLRSTWDVVKVTVVQRTRPPKISICLIIGNSEGRELPVIESLPWGLHASTHAAPNSFSGAVGECQSMTPGIVATELSACVAPPAGVSNRFVTQAEVQSEIGANPEVVIRISVMRPQVAPDRGGAPKLRSPMSSGTWSKR